VFENSGEGEKWKIRKKIGEIQEKFRKNRLKCTGDDGGTVEIRNTEIRLVLAIYWLISPINW
jgi:hypothetical protein